MKAIITPTAVSASPSHALSMKGGGGIIGGALEHEEGE
jgi:hypothetical protein